MGKLVVFEKLNSPGDLDETSLGIMGMMKHL